MDVVAKLMGKKICLRIDDKKKVYIINGAPGSGKTTYVQKIKTPNDLVVDFDYICAALNGTDKLYQDYKPFFNVAISLREELYRMIASRYGNWGNAYVILTESNRVRLQSIAQQLDANIITMPTTLEQCINNILADDRRKGQEDKFIKLAKEWYKDREKNIF